MTCEYLDQLLSASQDPQDEMFIKRIVDDMKNTLSDTSLRHVDQFLEQDQFSQAYN